MKRNAVKIFEVFLKKNLPSILTGIAVTGVIATPIMAIEVTPKALNIIDMHKATLKPEEEITPKEIFQLCWKLYLPTGIMAVITIACVISANSVNKKRHAILAGLYSLSEAAAKEYHDKVIDAIGKNKERKINDEIAQEKVNNHPINNKEIIITGAGETLCLDAYTGRYFKSDIEKIRKVINDLSFDLINDKGLSSYISLNEMYYALDLEQVKMGDMLGWHVKDGPLKLEFTSALTPDGKPCLVIDFTNSLVYVDM